MIALDIKVERTFPKGKTGGRDEVLNIEVHDQEIILIMEKDFISRKVLNSQKNGLYVNQIQIMVGFINLNWKQAD